MGTLTTAVARQLPAQAADAAGRTCQYLTFTLSRDLYALPIASIKEIIEYRSPTDVPMMPGFIRGVINLRGRVVPVVDLAVRFGRARSEATRRTCIVILEIVQEGVQHDIGVVVDAVMAVLDIADADVEPPPSFGARLRSDFIRGMGKVDEKFVIILSVDSVLSIDELSRLAGGAEVEDANPNL